VAYGHTVGKILAFAFIKQEHNIANTEVEVIIAGKSRQGKIHGQAAYDPQSVLPRTDAA